jgi:cholesterol oxidase
MRYDFVIIGSGFGGSVSALRLAEKGWKVLVIEKGRRFAPADFPKNNWQLRDWLWRPELGMTGIFQMSFLSHVTVLHGVGVGGGSLVYANTLPTPKAPFFQAKSWSHLADWQRELAPHYQTARQMLGAATNPRWTRGDEVLAQIAGEIGRAEHHHPTEVAVYFGKAGKSAPDPYFGGRGPERTGCTFCGACMTGCRVGAKNTLDRNYLYLAEQLGAVVQAGTEVISVRPAASGYRVLTRPSLSRGSEQVIEADRVIFAGGVMGTIPLLLALRDDGDLPKLSAQVGMQVRTNSESLVGVVAPDNTGERFCEGVAITSILHTDEHSHIEPVRYGPGSGFFRLLATPHAPGDTLLARVGTMLGSFMAQPTRWLAALRVSDFATRSQVLLYMRTLDGTLSLRLGRSWRTGFTRGLQTWLDDPSAAPAAFIDEADQLVRRFAEIVGGVPMSMVPELLSGVPTTAHILGGACMGADADEGVIDPLHRVHGYDGLYVVDGSAMSANPGVNPSLTITALAERAMAAVPARS